jgi:hypothetical protein
MCLVDVSNSTNTREYYGLSVKNDDISIQQIRLCENLADFSQSHSQVEFLNN